MPMTKKRSLTPTPVRLSPEARQSLAELADLDAETAKPYLDSLEIILNDHAFITDWFESPKPNEVRDYIAPSKGAGLKKKAEALVKTLDRVPRGIPKEFSLSGFDLMAFQDHFERFRAATDAMLAFHADKTITRRPRQQVRDQHTIPDIADLFDRMCARKVNAESDWEHLDRKRVFVSLALECAGIPCSKRIDTRRGEVKQDRLRRQLKRHEQKRRDRARRKQHQAT